MVALTQNYVPEQTEEQTGFEAMPAGDYPAVAIDSEIKDTNKGDGKYLQVTYEIIEGPMKNRRVWGRFTLINPNSDAEKIGHSQLKSFASAAGKPNARDSEELHNIPVTLNIVVKDSPQYGKQNDIKSFKPYGQVSTTGEATNSENSPSWMKK